MDNFNRNEHKIIDFDNNDSSCNQIYFDYSSTTPIDDRVLNKMIFVYKNFFGNPHSRSHKFGWEAARIVEESRKNIADLINAKNDEIVFTSGATESNNIAIKGVARFYKNSNKNHIITLSTEHKCVIESCRALQREGFEITFLKPNEDGLIDPLEIEKHITSKTILVSVMAVNNEIGVIQQLKEIGKITRKNNVFFHTDAAQAFGKIKIDVKDMKIDLLSISGHKIYGPKGIGALYVGKNPRVRISSIVSGGGQERGIRSGTAPVPLIAGMGEASKIYIEYNGKETEKITNLAKYFYNEIMKIESIQFNGSTISRYWGILNFSFLYIEGESFLMSLKDLAISSGSACTSSTLEPSYVLKSLGFDDEVAHSSIRFSIGRMTTKEEIDFAINIIQKSVQKLRELSPLWEMVQSGIDLKTVKWESH